MRQPTAESDGGCSGFDYASESGQAAIVSTLNQLLAIRDELTLPVAARRVGRTERLYERSLGLAVLPMLLWRGVRRAAGRDSSVSGAKLADPATELVREVRLELERGGGERKMRLYDRSLGLAVFPVLVRRRMLQHRLRPE